MTASVFIEHRSVAQDRKVGNARQWSARPLVCLRGQLKNKVKQPLRGESHFTIQSLKGDFHFTLFKRIETTKSYSDITFFPRLWNFKCCIPLQWIGYLLRRRCRYPCYSRSCFCCLHYPSATPTRMSSILGCGSVIRYLSFGIFAAFALGSFF